jgi:hypothetical protein
MTGNDASRLTPLPVRPRPRRGEAPDDCVRRLAAANHLPFSYLRRYLGRRSYGPVDPAMLAALAGRDLAALIHALPDLTPRPSGRPHAATRQTTSSAAARPGERSTPPSGATPTAA